MAAWVKTSIWAEMSGLSGMRTNGWVEATVSGLVGQRLRECRSVGVRAV